jgi:hypothetical protein
VVRCASKHPSMTMGPKRSPLHYWPPCTVHVAGLARGPRGFVVRRRRPPLFFIFFAGDGETFHHQQQLYVDGGPPTPSAGSLWPHPAWFFAESVMRRRTRGLPGPGPASQREVFLSAVGDERERRGEERRGDGRFVLRVQTPRWATASINARLSAS